MNTFSNALLEICKILSVFIMLCALFHVTQEMMPIKYPKQMLVRWHVHKSLYIDKNLNPFYAVSINNAAARWTKATNGIAEFDVQIIDEYNRDKIRHDPDAVVVTFVTEDHPDVIRIDQENKDTTLAFCICNGQLPIAVLAYVATRIPDRVFEQVTMHELGHALSLEHTTGPMGAGNIMYPTISLMGEGISKGDLKQFCSIYHCDPTKLQNEEEPLHL